MKHILLATAIMLVALTGTQAQDISSHQVPQAIRNNFQQSFPEAKDVDWEKENGQYKVEFEIGFWNDDHMVCYDTSGIILRHKEEVSKRELPKAVKDAIDKNYKFYMVRDVVRNTEGKVVTYQVELQSLTKEWDIVYDTEGKELSKLRD